MISSRPVTQSAEEPLTGSPIPSLSTPRLVGPLLDVRQAEHLNSRSVPEFVLSADR